MDDLATAKAFISKQIDLVKAAEVAALVQTFTERLHDRITLEAIESARGRLGGMTIDDFVAAVEADDGALKIKMKNGRTLTTLVQANGAWRADTVWIK